MPERTKWTREMITAACDRTRKAEDIAKELGVTKGAVYNVRLQVKQRAAKAREAKAAKAEFATKGLGKAVEVTTDAVVAAEIKPKVHWTQRPENAGRMKEIARQSHLTRKSRPPKVKIEASWPVIQLNNVGEKAELVFSPNGRVTASVVISGDGIQVRLPNKRRSNMGKPIGWSLLEALGAVVE